MQLKSRPLGPISAALGVLTANLMVAGAAHAQAPINTADINQDTSTDVGLTRIDSGILFYQEAGGRVQATEPVATATLNDDAGDILTVKLTSDIVTGATPNGAAPWTGTQSFVTPAQAPGSSSTVTSASGHSTIITIPGSGTVASQYSTPAGQLPLAQFHDHRYALNLGYTQQITPGFAATIGGGYSRELDFTALTGVAGVSRTFNQNRTTASLSLDLEHDISRPRFGTPDPLSVMSGEIKGSDATRNNADLVFGVSQVLTRRWLTQLNLSTGYGSGNMSDPYRIISVVDGATGAPQQYLYESRPGSRRRTSLYWGNKIALGPTYADLSARAYSDSWGIRSFTVEASDRIGLSPRFYVEPGVRYYHQSAADFYAPYLISGAALPAFASSDSRLDAFTATTESVRVGYRFTPKSEFYALAQHYDQRGDALRPTAPGALANLDLFSGVKATSLVVGYSFAFR